MNTRPDGVVPPTLDVEPVPPTLDVEPVPPRRDVQPTLDVDPADPGFYFPFELPTALATRYERLPLKLPPGGQSEIMLVSDRATGERRIVKRYRRQQRHVADIAEALMDADPRHVVRLYPETGQYGDHWFEVMEYLEHGTLADFDGYGSRPLDAALVTSVVREVAAALRYIHAALGLVHRDVKPTNVLRRSVDPLALVLADLGTMAMQETGIDFASIEVGTWQYSLLEVRTGRTDAARDWGSFGIVVYEMVTGGHPFRAPDGTFLESGHVTEMLAEGTAIDLEAVTDRRFRLLCAGLLSMDREGAAARWGHDEVADWLAVRPVRDVETARPPRILARRRLPPYVFDETPYESPEPLAAALALHWDEALRILVGRRAAIPTEFRRFQQFFRDRGRDDVADLAASVSDDSAGLLRLLVAMHPALPATYRGHDVSPAGLIALCVEARSAESAPARELLRDLHSGGVLTELLNAPGCAEYPAVDSAWRRGMEEWQRLTATAGLPDLVIAELDLARANLLNALLDPEYAARLAERAAMAASDQLANECAWFRRLASHGQNRRAGQAALTLLVESAREEARAARARAESEARARAEAQAARRRQLEQEADDILNDLDGPVSRYRVALELERAAIESFDGILGRLEALDPVPTQGSLSDRLVALVALIPTAAARLRYLADQASTAARQRWAEAEAQVAALQVAAPPLPQAPARPRAPAPNPAADSYRMWRALMVPAVFLGLPACFCGVFNPLQFKTNGPMWIELVVVIASGIVVAIWNSARTSGGAEAVVVAEWEGKQYAAELRQYEKAFDDYERLAEARTHAESRRRADLARAREHHASEGRAADTLDALARRSRAAAADLMDDAMTRRLHSTIRRPRDQPLDQRLDWLDD